MAVRHTIGMFGGQQTGTAPGSPVSMQTGSSVGSYSGTASASNGRPGLMLLAIGVLALAGFSYWTK